MGLPMMPRPMKPMVGFAIVFSFLLPIADPGNITLLLQFAATEITGADYLDNEMSPVLTAALDRIGRCAMLGSYRVYDADAHVILAPAMWEDLAEKYIPRRPRPATFSDSGDMAVYEWLAHRRTSGAAYFGSRIATGE